MIRYSERDGVNLGDLNEIEFRRSGDPDVEALLELVRKLDARDVPLNAAAVRDDQKRLERLVPTLQSAVRRLAAIEPKRGTTEARAEIQKTLADFERAFVGAVDHLEKVAWRT